MAALAYVLLPKTTTADKIRNVINSSGKVNDAIIKDLNSVIGFIEKMPKEKMAVE